MITHTISVPEAIWTIFCSIGLIFASRLLWRAFGNWSFLLEQDINGIRRYAALTTVFVHFAFMMTMVGYVVIGAMAMTIPSPNNKIQPLTYIISAVFSIQAIGASILGATVDFRKKHLLEILSLQEIEKESGQEDDDKSAPD